MVKPFVKWPGGKSEEIDIIHRYIPNDIQNYIEPFLGGGACFLSLDVDSYNESYVNDFSHELISLYRMIKENNEVFNNYLQDIWNFWNSVSRFSVEFYNVIRGIYRNYKDNILDDAKLKIEVNQFIDVSAYMLLEELPVSLSANRNRLLNEFNKSLLSKLKNIKRKELKDGDLPEADYKSNFEAGIRASIYTYYRYLYNHISDYNIDEELNIALFYYIREFCYSSMFRYNNSGEFNVPYGGLSYNNKRFNSKIENIRNEELQNILVNAEIYNLDFEDFLRRLDINNNDFMFLDPPYDGGFSTYANNTFEQEDQIRLANYLINECESRFMLVIKNTDFIANLYGERRNINIIGFAKDYKVSFMDRNDKNVKHLLITNY
ncbi:DNA adenine methylase [Clostridium tagluense]|uniref:DNA adenine methylase n=1 Tax=Clostridium tagluense TaxID=360422 RepID=UPI001CF52C27|nr:DNA adenine methylase [Clostridium tagluense]MCB2312326.1 DNA adenine methylase [Clostridium tagluense]MCB2316936.1 DNA adenine methylase [Clostridium tagluense]MCB2321865.1 DNA adenine methylase [Clostridium tagluense]MCB2326715.1 DNA adenine methylase [Clostridium tagluense]MCB2331528.1 DNA adenine methylase [Clostridium tagluense]